jgi:hypothetical protein
MGTHMVQVKAVWVPIWYRLRLHGYPHGTGKGYMGTRVVQVKDVWVPTWYR